MKNPGIIRLILIAFICAFTSMTSAGAQQLMHSFGITISVMQGTLHEGPGNSESFAVEQNNFTYFPRFNFVENENSSISVGAPIGIGVGIATNTMAVMRAYFFPMICP